MELVASILDTFYVFLPPALHVARVHSPFPPCLCNKPMRCQGAATTGQVSRGHEPECCPRSELNAGDHPLDSLGVHLHIVANLMALIANELREDLEKKKYPNQSVVAASFIFRRTSQVLSKTNTSSHWQPLTLTLP